MLPPELGQGEKGGTDQAVFSSIHETSGRDSPFLSFRTRKGMGRQRRACAKSFLYSKLDHRHPIRFSLLRRPHLCVFPDLEQTQGPVVEDEAPLPGDVGGLHVPLPLTLWWLLVPRPALLVFFLSLLITRAPPLHHPQISWQALLPPPPNASLTRLLRLPLLLSEVRVVVPCWLSLIEEGGGVSKEVEGVPPAVRNCQTEPRAELRLRRPLVHSLPCATGFVWHADLGRPGVGSRLHGTRRAAALFFQLGVSRGPGRETALMIMPQNDKKIWFVLVAFPSARYSNCSCLRVVGPLRQKNGCWQFAGGSSGSVRAQVCVLAGTSSDLGKERVHRSRDRACTCPKHVLRATGIQSACSSHHCKNQLNNPHTRRWNTFIPVSPIFPPAFPLQRLLVLPSIVSFR